MSLLLFVTLTISKNVTLKTSRNQLKATIKENSAYLELKDGIFYVDDAFSYYKNGVTTLIYSKDKSLLAGQIPIDFPRIDGFENGSVRNVSGNETDFLVVDLYVPLVMEEGYYLRSLMPYPDLSTINQQILIVSSILLPILIMIMVGGCYCIIKKAFKPLEDMNQITKQINEVKDLSTRVPLGNHQDEFNELGTNFNDLLIRLEKMVQSEIQFTSDASHELRTPIAIINGACEYGLKYDETKEEREETLSMIHDQSKKMQHLVESLLSITRMQQRTQKIELEVLSMKDLVNEALEVYELDNIHFECKQDVYVEGDMNLLIRVVQNLVDNAIKYGSEDKDIDLTLKLDNQYAILQVKDHGYGIPQEEIEHIFKRFYQVEKSREGSGLGLGLAIVSDILEIHHGFIECVSEVGKGSTFIVKIPQKKI